MKLSGSALSVSFIFVFIFLCCTNALADQGKAFEGRKLFTTYCYLCHGMSGKGDGPLAANMKVAPIDLTKPKLGQKTEAEIQCLIDGSCKSHASSDMSKWSRYIPEPKMKALVSYVRYLSTSKNPLIGNPDAGEHVYEQYCSPCHGKKGKGDGIMGGILSVKPADHTNSEKMDNRSNTELIEIITNGRGKDSLMPGWKGILSEKEIDDVVSYMRFLAH